MKGEPRQKETRSERHDLALMLLLAAGVLFSGLWVPGGRWSLLFGGSAALLLAVGAWRLGAGRARPLRVALWTVATLAGACLALCGGYAAAAIAALALLAARVAAPLRRNLRHDPLGKGGAEAGSRSARAVSPVRTHQTVRRSGWVRYRVVVGLLLACYAGGYVAWNLANKAPPTLCCHDSELSLFGISWLNRAARSVYIEQPSVNWLAQLRCADVAAATAGGFGTLIDEIPQSPVLQAVQGLYLSLVGLRPAVPHLPLLLVYLASLLCIYLLGERLHSCAAGLLAMLAALGTELFIYRPLAWRGQDGPAAALLPIAFLLVIGSSGTARRSLWRWLAAGAVVSVAVMTRWYIGLYGAALALLAMQGVGAGRLRSLASLTALRRWGARVAALAIPVLLVVLAIPTYRGFFLALAGFSGWLDKGGRAARAAEGTGWSRLFWEAGGTLWRFGAWPTTSVGRENNLNLDLLAFCGLAAAAAGFLLRPRLDRTRGWVPLGLGLLLVPVLGLVYKNGPQYLAPMMWLGISGGLVLGSLLHDLVPGGALRMTLLAGAILLTGANTTHSWRANLRGERPYDGTALGWHGVEAALELKASPWVHVRTGCGEARCGKLYSALDRAISEVLLNHVTSTRAPAVGRTTGSARGRVPTTALGRRRVASLPGRVCSYGFTSGFPSTVLGDRELGPTWRYLWTRAVLELARTPRSEWSVDPGPGLNRKLVRWDAWPFDPLDNDPAVLYRKKRKVVCPWLLAIDRRRPEARAGEPISPSFRFRFWRQAHQHRRVRLWAETSLDRSMVFRVWRVWGVRKSDPDGRWEKDRFPWTRRTMTGPNDVPEGPGGRRNTSRSLLPNDWAVQARGTGGGADRPAGPVVGPGGPDGQADGGA